MTEEVEIKSYKVLKQLGWQGSTYAEGDTVEMEPRFAEYYLNEKVLGENETARHFSEESPPPIPKGGPNPPRKDASTSSETPLASLPLEQSPENSTSTTTTIPTTEPEAS